MIKRRQFSVQSLSPPTQGAPLQVYKIALLVVGVAAFAVAWLPRILRYRVLSFPIILVLLGMGIFSLPIGFEDLDPIRYGKVTERLAELGVLLALTGAGLKIDRRVGLKSWKTTWLLLGVTMPLTIAAVAWLGWWALGFAPASALLLGAALAPTDPVLASDVQVGAPNTEETGEVRFALTSEAGFNDGLAFPFTNAAIAVALSAGSREWVGEWLLVDVVYRIVAGLVIGYLSGKLLAYLVFRVGDHETKLSHSREGLIALAVTLISYALAELAHGYGFVAVFVAALAIRDFERDHEYHRELDRFGDQLERFASAVILVLFGGALANGLLSAISLEMFLVAISVVIVIRPLTGMIGIGALKMEDVEKPAIAFLGIRGIGSFYYLAHGLNEAPFSGGRELWAAVSMVVLLSILIHGLTAKPAIEKVTEEAEETEHETEVAGRKS